MQTKSKFVKLHEIACFSGGGANMSTSSTRTRTIALAAALLALPSFADPLTWEGATNLTMTANTTVDVPAGATNVIDTLAGAYTLTKTGGGVLEVRYSKSASAKFVVSEGLLRFANPRPDDIFAKAYFHVDASDLSSMEIETVNGTNFVTRWNDTDGRTDRYATHCTTVWNCRKDPENRKPFLRMNFQNGLPVMDFGSLLTKYNTNEVGQALGYGAAMKFDQTSPYVKEGFNVWSDTEDYDEWPNVPSFSDSMNGMSIFSNETAYRFIRHPFSGASNVYLGLLNDNGKNNDYFATGRSVWLDGTLLSSHPKFAHPSMGFHILRIHPTKDGDKDGGTTFNSFAAEYNSSSDRSYGGQRIAEYALFTNRTETGESAMTTNEEAMVNRYLRVKWFPQTIAAVTVEKGASLVVDKSANLTITTLKDEGAFDLALSYGTHTFDYTISGVSASIHVDASKIDTMTIVEKNGTNFVSRWKNLGSSSYDFVAEADEGANGDRGINYWRTNMTERPLPYISPDVTQNGLSVIDLGVFAKYNNTNANGSAFKLEGLPKFTFAEYLSVIADREELKTTNNGAPGPSYIAYRGGTAPWSGQNEGRRGELVSGKNPPLFRSSNNTPCVNGTNYVNNVEQAYTYNPPDGFNIINIRPRLPANNFYCNLMGRNIRGASSQTIDSYGGQRVAEYMLFSSILAEEKRQRLYNTLRSKWFGDVPATTNFYNSLSLGAKSVMTVKYEAVAVTNRLALAGALAAPSVFAANVDVSGTNATVNAPLTVPDGVALSFARQDDGAWSALSVKSLAAEGAVRVVLAAKSQQGLGGTSARLVAAETPIESIDGWTLEWNGKHEATMSLREGDVWVEFAKSGSIILFR